MWFRLIFVRFFLRFILIPILALIFGGFILFSLLGITYTWIFFNTLKILKENVILGILLIILELTFLALIIFGVWIVFDKIKKWLRRREL